MDNYLSLSDSELRKIQNYQVYLLYEFDKICEKLNIKYELYGGTLIGAVRHGGFIPWDDDLDVSMLREDYDKFMQEGIHLLPENIFLQNNITDPEYPLNYAKLRLEDSVFLEPLFKDFNIHQGIFMDIFPIDGIPKSLLKRRIFYWRLKILFYVNRAINYDINSISRNMIQKFIYRFLKILGSVVSKEQLDRIIYDRMTMYCESEIVANITKPLNWGLINNQTRDTRKIKRRQFKFEGEYFYGPEDYDKLLDQRFGNYLDFPPKDQQVPGHVIIELKFPDEL